MKLSTPLGVVIAALANALVPASALAQPADPNFALEIFDPMPAQGINLMNLATTEVLGHLRPAVGLVFHYQDDPFLLVDANDIDRVEQRVVDHVLKAEVTAALGLFDIFDIGLAMPVILSQRAGELLTQADPPASFTSFTVSDLRLVPKLRIIDNERAAGFGLAVVVPIHLPTGDANSYQSEGVVRVEPRLVLDWRHRDGFVATVNIGYMPRARRQVLNFVNSDALRFGAGLHVPLVGRTLGIQALVHGSVGLADGDAETDTASAAVEALGAVQVRFDDFWVASLGAGGGVTGGVGSPDVRVVASVGWTPVRNRADTDRDGIIDAVDDCPEVPEDMDGFEDADGCPDLDNDQDGIADLGDGALDATGFGVCRDQPEDKDGFEDGDGCPDLDNDQDGIADRNDGAPDMGGFGACRDFPEDRDGFEDADGCPDLDNDGDGIVDVNDGPVDASGFGSCRDKPENRNEWEDDDGCPDERPLAVLRETGIAILEKIYFDFDKATLQARSFPVLDAVVAILKANPQITLIRVEGHTDTVGTRPYNLRLSQRRAETVVAWLKRQGIDPRRVFGRGYGFDYPLEPNDTQEGRDRNRRVEFNILEIDGKPIQNPVIRAPLKATGAP